MADVHPNGPRTFATLLRDNVPLPQEMLEWIRAADSGHPTLTQLRSSLGIDLDLNASNGAARAAWPARGAPPDKKDAARVIDAMYGAITSSRLVRVEIVEEGLHASREDERIVMRDGRLALWLFADNKTTKRVRLSVADRPLDVESGRTGSILLDAGLVRPGSQKVPITIASGGRTAVVALPVECQQTGTLRASLIDDATEQPVAARVYLRDDLGPAWPAGATPRRDFHGNVFFHAEGTFDVQICGTAHLRVVRGMEYEAAEREVSVGADATVETSVRLRRWSHRAADGWYSGDVHVHLHYGGEYLLSPADAALVQRAEDVHFMNMMVANQGSGWVHDAENFTGADHLLSENDHILRWGEEYRNNFYGHMCMFGVRELVPPIYSGFPNSEQPHDLPSNAEAAAHCHSVGGTLSYAHPMFESIELDRVFAPEHRLSVEAKELPVDAALGRVDAVDVLAYPANTAESCKLWYRLLNCGLRLAATAGTDTFMNLCDQRMFSNPPAGDRVFVRVEGGFTTDSWCDGVRAGRTFVTNGPMLSLDVEGHMVGDQIGAQAGQVLRVEGAATSSVPIDRLELIVNGGVVASAEADNGGRRASISHDLRLGGSCWIALRCSGAKDELVLDPDGAFAHTSPVYVAVAGARLALREDAAYFVEWIERLVATTESRARFPSDAAREAVIAVFREGQAYYRTLA
ncbi:MAG: CehA/McbA family metallohydrolase [Dehalococcoidia bacterium]